MFDIRKIQEQVIYHTVKAESDDRTAQTIVIENNRLAESGSVKDRS